MSFADALCPRHDFRSGCNQSKEPGAIVMAGRNLGPRFRILAIEGESAWIRQIDNGRDGIARLDRLRVIAEENIRSSAGERHVSSLVDELIR